MTDQRPDFARFGLDPAFVGSSVDDWLEAEGLTEEVHHQAVKELLAEQLTKAMAERGLSKSRFAAAINTSRSQLDRILDPRDNGVSLATLVRAAAFLGLRLRLELVPAPQPKATTPASTV